MREIVRNNLAALIMAIASLPASPPVFSADCETREVGRLTFSNCHEREPGNVMAGRFDSTNVNAATEKGASISVPILAGKKEALVFSEIGPIPNVLPQVELEKSHAIKPVEANKNPAMKRKETSKKKPRAKSGIAR